MLKCDFFIHRNGGANIVLSSHLEFFNTFSHRQIFRQEMHANGHPGSILVLSLIKEILIIIKIRMYEVV